MTALRTPYVPPLGGVAQCLGGDGGFPPLRPMWESKKQ